MLSRGHNCIADVDEIFDILAFSDEDPKISEGRFRNAFHKIDWSSASRDIVEFVSNWRSPEDCAALHVRAGGIPQYATMGPEVSRQWEQSLPSCPTQSYTE